MKGLILAAGSGTRLRPFTHTQPKQLLPVGGKAILEYGIEAMAAAGIRDIGVVVGVETEAALRAYLEGGARWGVRISYVFQPEPKGLAHAVLCAEEFLDRQPFVMYLGDNLFQDPLTEMMDAFQRIGQGAVIALKEVSNPCDFGVAELDSGGRVVRLVEKPAEPPSNLAVVGVYVFSPEIVGSCRRVCPSNRGEMEITDAIQGLIDDGRPVLAHRLIGWWKDTGKPRHLLEANELVLDSLQRATRGRLERTDVEGKVVVEAGARLVDCTVRGPAFIGRDVVGESSRLGPYVSLGPRVQVSDSHIAHSIAMEEADVRGVQDLRWTILGRRTCVVADGSPRTISLLLGDDAQAHLGRRAVDQATKGAR